MLIAMSPNVSETPLLATLVTTSADRAPESVAIADVDGNAVFTYAGLVAYMAGMQTRLRAAGVGPGEMVLLSVPNGPLALAATVGTMASAACVPVNPSYGSVEIAGLFDALEPKAVVAVAGPLADEATKRGVTIVDPAFAPEFDAALVADADPAHVSLVLHTGGTTGIPKHVPLTQSNIAAATRNVIDSLQLTSDDVVLNVMPLFHSHGLLGCALSTLGSGGRFVAAEQFDQRVFLDWARTAGATWYSAAPTLHRLVVSAPGEYKGWRFFRSASGPIPPDLAAQLQERFETPFIEVYGMTEAYQMAANPLPPGERRLGTVGLPTGTEIRILTDDLSPAAADEDGEIAVRGPAVFSGYLHNPKANESAFVDGWFCTGDIGSISADGYLRISGRLGERINRGGEKVAPREVDEALLMHPDVVDAMSFGYPDELLGEEVGALVVLAAGKTLELSDIRTFLTGKVAPFKIPRRIKVVDAVPKTDTGKLKRTAGPEILLASAPGAGASADASKAKAGTKTVGWLQGVWMELLDLDAYPAPDANFFSLGGTSLLTLSLLGRIQDEKGVSIPSIEVMALPTLQELADLIDAGGSGAARLVRPFGPIDPALPTVLLVPGRWGFGVAFDLIAEQLLGKFNVHVFDFPGIQEGTEPRETIEGIAEELARSVREAGLPKTFAIYGNSMGSWVTVEAVRLLHGDYDIVGIGIGDIPVPGLMPQIRSNRNLEREAKRMEREAAGTPTGWERIVNGVRWRLVKARRLAGRVKRRILRQTTPQPPDIDLRGQRPEVVAASDRAMEVYRMAPLTHDLLVLTTPKRRAVLGDDLGWRGQTSGEVVTVPVGGGHETMYRTEAVPIAAAVSDFFLPRLSSGSPE